MAPSEATAPAQMMAAIGRGVDRAAARVGRNFFGFGLAAFLKQQEGAVRIQHGHVFDAIAAMIAIVSITAPPTVRIIIHVLRKEGPK